MKIKLSVLMNVSRRYTALLLACTMLFNLTSEAAAQYRSFTPTTGGGIPPFDYKAPADNTRVASKNLDIKLTQAKLKSEVANINTILSYEEVKKEVLKINKAVPLSETVVQAIYQQYLQDVAKQDSEVNKTFQIAKNDFHLDYYLNEAYKQGSKGGKVCIDKKCYEQANFVQGILRASLYQGLGEDQSHKKFQWNREIMLAEIPNIYGALEMGGVHRKDAAKLQKYIKFILEKADDYCDNDTYLVDIMPGLGSSFSGKSNGRKADAEQGKERRRKQCENVGKALVVLGMAGQTVSERGANAAVIYKVMKDTYKDDYGAITAMNGAAGLIAAGTVSSYNYLDRFLTVDTLNGATDFGTFWNGCKWVLDLLSVQKWIEKGTTVNNRLRGRGGRYLNQLGAVYQYIDEDAASSMGISNYQVSVMKTHPSLGYNIPYRNVLEDLGILVSTTGTKQGNQIAARILSIYASNVKRSGNAMDEVHTPLVAGVLSTGVIKDANAQYAAQKMNSLDWWDLNEATQRRINNIATKYSGTTVRNKDQAKIKRNENNQKIIQAGFWADMAITAVFMGMLVASIPNMVRSAANFARNVSRIRAINAAGKGNLLKIVRVNIKASGIKPADIKIARQAKQAQAAEVARAERLLKQKGIKKDVYGNPLKEANSAQVKSAAAKVKAAKQPKAVKKTPQTEQVQFKVVTKEGQNALVNRNGTLTAVVGEGSGGSGAVSGAKTLTAAEKAQIAARTAKDAAEADAKATAAAEELMRESAYAAANPRPFKGNLLFNKPYKELTPWRKWAFDTYYFRINPAFKLTGDITKGLARNPGKTTMMGSLPMGTMAEALVANPVGIYTTVSRQANSGFSVVRLAQEASTAGQSANIVKTGNSLLKVKNMVSPLTPIQKAMALGGMVNLPKLVTVLNEPHTGSTGSMRVSGSTSNYYTSAVSAQTSLTAKEEDVKVKPEITPTTPAAEPVKLTPLLNPQPIKQSELIGNSGSLAAETLLPQGWTLTNQQNFNAAEKLVAEVGTAATFPLPAKDAITQNIPVADPVLTLGFALPFFGRFRTTLKTLANPYALTNPSNSSQANRYAKNILSKEDARPSQLAAIVKSAARDEYRANALYALYADGMLWEDTKDFNESELKLMTRENILNLYNKGTFDRSFASLRDTYMPKQVALTRKEQEKIEATKQFVNNENELVQAGLSEWGTGETPFEAPTTNRKLIDESLRSLKYIEENTPKGVETKAGTYYKDVIPVYYRSADGVISNNPRILLTYSKVSAFSNFLSSIGLASKKGYLVPKGLVIAMDEEGKMKYVMPMGKMSEVEKNKKSRDIIIEQTETNRVAVDSEFTSSDLVEMAYLLGKDSKTAFEINLNKPDSFKVFLAFHALFIGNDAGNTLTGQFKGSVGNAGGAAAVNGIGGVGYLTPFIGGALMGYMSKKGHVPTIITVYTVALAALAYSIFGVGMDGFYSFPKDPGALDFIKLGIPTTVMVLGGSILNTSIQTLLNIYKDPVARSTAHLQFANNKNYSRLAVSAITGLALVSGMGLNWSVVVPAAAVLLLAAGALLVNTRIYDKFKATRLENKAKQNEARIKRQELSKEESAAIKEALQQEAAAKKALEKEFHSIYKKELSKKYEMKDISKRVSKLYASYAASLLVITQTLKLAADKVSAGTGENLAIGLLAAVAAPILLKLGYDKIKGNNSNTLKELKKYSVPLVFFATTLVTMALSQTGSALGMTLTTLCLLTTTMMRAYSTELIKARKATDDQLSGLSIPLIALMTSLLVFAPTAGPGAIASLIGVLLLYAGTAVPGGLDSARMQNFITSEYKLKKGTLLKDFEDKKIDRAQYDAAKKRLAAEEKYMSSKGASKFSYLNGAGIIGIMATVLGAMTLQDMATHPGPWMPEVLTQWQGTVLDAVSKITGNAGESHAIALTRIILAYAAVVAAWMTAENMHLTKAAKGLFKPQKTTQEQIDKNLVGPKTFDINKKNAGIKLSALDKELKEINGVIFRYGKSSEQKMTESLNKLFYINNRLNAIGAVLGEEAIAKSYEQLKYVTANLDGMIQHNDLSFQYKRQFGKLKDALINGHMKYVEEGLYQMPASLKHYEFGVMLVRELDNRAAYILRNKIHKDSYKEFLMYYSRAVQELTQYAQDTPNDAERVNVQINKIKEISSKLETVDHTKHKVVPKEDVENLMEAIKLFKGNGTYK